MSLLDSQAEFFTFMGGLIKSAATFMLSWKIVTDKEILDLKIAAVAKFIAKTVF